MPNIATNIAMIRFPNDVSRETLIEFLNIMDERLGLDTEPYPNPNYPQSEVEPYFELNFSSSWSAPIEILQDLADKYNCSIKGVCYEWGCEYVDSYNITPDLRPKVSNIITNYDNKV